MRRFSFVFGIALSLLIGGCARLPSTTITTLKPANTTELRDYLLSHKPDVDLFRSRGPFAVTSRKNQMIVLLDGEQVLADVYLSAPTQKSALVVVLHGHENSKADHAYQAWHVASWGLHSLALQLPNTGPWVANGQTLARVVEYLYRRPELIDPRVDPARIVLAGHSFGAAATAIALAEGAPAAGAVLLDPARVGKDLPTFLGRIKKPVLIIGADEERTHTRDRDNFFRYIRSGVGEVSIKDAVHDDAEYPAEIPVRWFGSESEASEEMRISFVSALTAAAFSLSATGKFDYAWASFGDAIKDGRMFNQKKK